MNLQEILIMGTLPLLTIILFVIVLYYIKLRMENISLHYVDLEKAYMWAESIKWNDSVLSQLVDCINPDCIYTDKEMDYWRYFINALDSLDYDDNFYCAGCIYCALTELNISHVIPDSIQRSTKFIEGSDNIQDKMKNYIDSIAREDSSEFRADLLLYRKDTIHSALAKISWLTKERN